MYPGIITLFLTTISFPLFLGQYMAATVRVLYQTCVLLYNLLKCVKNEYDFTLAIDS